MTFFKQKSNIIFLFVIFLLLAALSGVSYFAYEKHTEYAQISVEISSNSSALQEAQKKIDELTAKMADYDALTAQNEQNEQEKTKNM